MRTAANGRRTAILNAQTDAIALLLREVNQPEYTWAERRLIQRAHRTQYVANVRACRALFPLETEVIRLRAA